MVAALLEKDAVKPLESMQYSVVVCLGEAFPCFVP